MPPARPVGIVGQGELIGKVAWFVNRTLSYGVNRATGDVHVRVVDAEEVGCCQAIQLRLC